MQKRKKDGYYRLGRDGKLTEQDSEFLSMPTDVEELGIMRHVRKLKPQVPILLKSADGVAYRVEAKGLPPVPSAEVDGMLEPSSLVRLSKDQLNEMRDMKNILDD